MELEYKIKKRSTEAFDITEQKLRTQLVMQPRGTPTLFDVLKEENQIKAALLNSMYQEVEGIFWQF